MNFSDLNLHKEVLAGIKKAGFEKCMPVQETVLPVSLTGADVMVQSKTGSGKTAVFVITFLEEYLRKKEEGITSSCLIIAPTRELAVQIADDAKILCSGVRNFRIGCFYGGVGYESQKKMLAKGCNICVGTPGRLIDLMKSGVFKTDGIDTFVIDEADRLFDMGFYQDIKTIFKRLCDKTKRQTMLFSATLEMRVRELAWEYMNESREIELEPDSITVDQITQELYHVAKAEKFQLLLQLLKRENAQSVLIFTNLKYMAEVLAKRLSYNGYNADFLSGDLSQSCRQKALDKMKEGKTGILVATDVAARGLQIDDLPLVVNYDIPEDYENYVHRIGRTARAGKSGKAITLADEEFVYGLEAIEKYIKMKIPVIWPNLEEVEDLSLGKEWTGRKEHKEKTRKKAKVSGKENTVKKSQKPHTTVHGKSLGQMTEKERMEYYRRKYGSDLVKEKNKSAEKKNFLSKIITKLFGK